MNPEKSLQATFAADITQLIHIKLSAAINYIPFDESVSIKAVEAGWFCIDPPLVCREPIQGADAFSLDYTGVQEGQASHDRVENAVRSTVTSIKLFKYGMPYVYEHNPTPYTGNSYSVLAGADAPPLIVNQEYLETGISQLEIAISGLGNWQALSRANRIPQTLNEARILTNSECSSILTAIERSTVDANTLMQSLGN